MQTGAMAMGTRVKRRRQQGLFYAADVAEAPGHPFYKRLNETLDGAGFDGFCQERCRSFYHDRLGRPSLAPGVHFRLQLIGFFEGVDSERGIAWRVADSLSLRCFLGYAFHSAFSRPNGHPQATFQPSPQKLKAKPWLHLQLV